MRGYSQNIIEANEDAGDSIGVYLGKILIEYRYPAAEAAKELDVSRQTVYDWITGRTTPYKAKHEIIKRLIAKVKS
tara:strand:- start:4045 stop:4272 length:228 start_codon:yes stop_codon:yes gene_type:complete